MASARKLPSGSYRVNLFVGMENGKRKYKSFTAPTKKEAELLAAQYNLYRKEKPKCEMTVLAAAENPRQYKKQQQHRPACQHHVRGANTQQHHRTA